MLFTENPKSGNDACSTVKWSNKGDIILLAGFGNGRVSTFAFQHDGMYPVGKLNLGSPVSLIIWHIIKFRFLLTISSLTRLIYSIVGAMFGCYILQP